MRRNRPPLYQGAYSNGGGRVESNYPVILWGSTFRPFKLTEPAQHRLPLPILAPPSQFLLQLERVRTHHSTQLLLALHRQNGGSVPRLGVNIDHVATLRQARGGTDPDPLTASVLVELAGADGIVVHLREDRRHIQDRDLRLLRELIRTKLDLEMAADETMAKIALTIKPDMVTLVPEQRQELTTEGGLDVAGHRDRIQIGRASCRERVLVAV